MTLGPRGLQLHPTQSLTPGLSNKKNTQGSEGDERLGHCRPGPSGPVLHGAPIWASTPISPDVTWKKARGLLPADPPGSLILRLGHKGWGSPPPLHTYSPHPPPPPPPRGRTWRTCRCPAQRRRSEGTSGAHGLRPQTRGEVQSAFPVISKLEGLDRHRLRVRADPWPGAPLPGGTQSDLWPAASPFPRGGQARVRAGAGLCMSKRRGREVRRAHAARSQGCLPLRGEPWTSFSPPGWRPKLS